MSLVEELQEESMKKGDISDLLRKSLVVATKLGLDEFREWCEWELNGYNGVEVPGYRVVRGAMKAINPYNGLIPVISKDNFEIPIDQSVACLQHLIDGTTDDSCLVIQLPPKVQHTMMQAIGAPLECVMPISVAQLAAIIDVVRTTILKWSLKLEGEGIVGEGIRFSREEKDTARQHADELQSVVHIHIGKMVNSTIQSGSPGARQNHHRA